MTFEELKKFHDYLVEKGFDGNFTFYTATSCDWVISIPSIDFEFWFDKDHKLEETFKEFKKYVDNYALIIV